MSKESKKEISFKVVSECDRFGNITISKKRYEKITKTIEIAKTKRVDIAHLQDSKDCGEYNEVVKKLATLWRVLPLTEEEYQLVKEILK